VLAAATRSFKPYGVSKVRLHTDKDTGKSKGFAHVHFDTEEGLDRWGCCAGWAALAGSALRPLAG
jgi:hypothetical protein